MTEVAPAPHVPDHQGHLPGYLTGASAESAAQKLIDGGLFADILKTPAKAEATAPTSPREQPASQTVTQAEPTSEAQTTETADEGESYQSLEDFITKKGLERDSFFTLPVKAKVDGKDLDIPLAKLVESYQIGEHLSHKSNALAEERRSWEAQRMQAQNELANNLRAAQQLGQLAQQELLREYQGVTPDDPARFLAAQQRIGAIQTWLAQNQQAQSQLDANTSAAEQQRLLDAVPEWRDPAKFSEAQQQSAKYAAARGFTQAELSQLSNAVNGNHRFALVLRDAIRAADLQAKVDTLTQQLEGKKAAALKLVRTAPAMASPGARITQNTNSSRLQSARTAMSSGKMRSLDSQAAVAQALLDAGAA